MFLITLPPSEGQLRLFPQRITDPHQGFLSLGGQMGQHAEHNFPQLWFRLVGCV